MTQKLVLQPVYDPKHYRNHDKPIHDLKKKINPKICPKTKFNPK
jgi:hypothetical protein